MPQMRALLAFAALGLLAAPIAAAHADTAAVLVVGKAAATDRATVAAAVRSAAASTGWEFVDAPLAESEASTVVACLKGPQRWTCLFPAVAGKNVQRLIVVTVEPGPTPDSGTLALTEQVLLPGAAVTSDPRSCFRCSADMLTRIAFNLTRELLAEAATGGARTRIRTTSPPPENHEVAVAPRAVAGPAPVPPRPEAHPYRLPAGVAGAGAAAIAVGIGLQLAEDPPPVGQHQPARLVSTPGVALIAGGSVAIGVGAYLWLRATRERAPGSTPTVAVTPGGGIVGWAGHF